MSQAKRPVNVHKAYHAHVYFDNTNWEFAERFTNQAGARFSLKVGTLHKKNVGPHPQWSRQIVFAKKHFDELIPWLEQNRADLSILIHGLTGNDYLDHTDYAYWLGEESKLDTSIFKTDSI